MNSETIMSLLYKVLYTLMVASVFILAFKGLLIISDMEIPDEALVRRMCGMTMLICAGFIAMIVLRCTPLDLKHRINDLEKRIKELEKEND